MNKGFLSPNRTKKDAVPRVDVDKLVARMKRLKHGDVVNDEVTQPSEEPQSTSYPVDVRVLIQTLLERLIRRFLRFK